MKICPYCMGEHDERGKFCCRGHARMWANQEARARSQGQRLLGRIRKNRLAAEGEKQLWRDIAMGRKPVEEYTAEQKGRRKKRG